MDFSDGAGNGGSSGTRLVGSLEAGKKNGVVEGVRDCPRQTDVGGSKSENKSSIVARVLRVDGFAALGISVNP